MTDPQKGILAMIGAGLIWGLAPILYKALSHIPATEVLAHRTGWSLVLFSGILALQGRLGHIRLALTGKRQIALILAASVMISINWFIFILAIQIGHATEASLGYYIFPLVAVVIGRFVFGERLGRAQQVAVALAALAVGVLTWGLGVAPWISLVLAVSFGLYSAIKKHLPVGPMVSVTCETLFFLPLGLGILAYHHGSGQGAYGTNLTDSALLMLSGPLTALPLILFAFAARRLALSTVGLMQFINPTLQFVCAVAIFGEPFTQWHQIAFVLIWIAVAIFSVATLRQDKARRRSAIAASGVSAQIKNSASDASAKP
ncbi:MAG: chloramphenicol-sensitive protein RarD [Paracoccaceae bacterium]|jgi:chloramphenicol-sensitive protein RarD